VVLNDRGAAIKNNGGLNEMGINGIGTAGYPLTGYTERKMERSAEPGTVGFMKRWKKRRRRGKQPTRTRKPLRWSDGAPRGK
jgi:hypothetical protein